MTADQLRWRPIVRDRGDAVYVVLESINSPLLYAVISRGGRAMEELAAVGAAAARVPIQTIQRLLDRHNPQLFRGFAKPPAMSL